MAIGRSHPLRALLLVLVPFAGPPGTAGAAPSVPTAPPQEGAPAGESLAERVNRAIDAGVKWLRSTQREDGHFPCSHWSQDGETALCAYALVKSGVPPSDPSIVKAMEALRYEPWRSTYATAVRIALLEACGVGDYEETIRSAAKWLEEHQHESGLFAYPERQPDLSNSQYAALGFWIADRHGYQVRHDTWIGMLKELVRLQLDDGGFGYHERDEATGSMTTAGLAIGMLAIDGVRGDGRDGAARQKGEAAMERAWQWLADHFTVEGNPTGSREITPVNHLYYLFGLERVGAIGDRRKVGDHDWYAEGACTLVRMQKQDGQWAGPDATSFALLFLRRATFTGMKKVDHDEPLGGPLSGEARHPGPLVPFVRRWLVAAGIPDAKDQLLDEPYAGDATVEPRAGSSFRGRTWREQRSLGDRVEIGGEAGPGDRTLACAFTWLHVSEPFDGSVWIGADDGIAVQLDGAPLLSKHVHQPIGRDRLGAPVHLEAGVHRLLVRIENGSGPCGFTLRFADREGAWARQVRPSLSRTDPQLAETALAMPGLFPLSELATLLPPLPRRSLDFRSAKELEFLAFDRDGTSADDLYPAWIDVPAKRPGSPHPGAKGILALHPVGEKVAMRVLFRATLPPGAPKLHLRVSSEACGDPHEADFLLRVGLFDGKLDWIDEEVVGPSPKPDAPDASGWRNVDLDLSAHAGGDVLLLIECAAGGRRPWDYEHAFLDEIAIR